MIDDDLEHHKRLDPKNKFCRYSEIRTYSDNRVEITSGNKYINASWIHIPSHRHFIATQGPLKSTIEDFWEMCLIYNVNAIVMLCPLEEKGIEKCANYWDANLKKFQILKIEKDLFVDQRLIIRNLQVINKENHKSKQIIQIHLTNWGDHTSSINNFPLFIQMIEIADKYKQNGPILVHCSAGVGRTGTFISLYNLYHEIKEQINDKSSNEIKFSILNLVRKLKEMRLYLVENIDQYIMLYQFVQIFLEKNN